MTLRHRLYLTLEPTEKGGLAERIFEVVLITTIILNILAIVLSSVHEIEIHYEKWLEGFEYFSVGFFTVEYMARIYSIVEKPKYRDPVTGRLRYAVTLLALVDLLSFLPFYIAISVDLRFLRIFRLMSVFRMFKIMRYLHALSVFKQVLKDRKEQLVLSFFFILFVLTIISFIMFYAEHDAQPEDFSSIPATMWWGIATLTTVGYGDMVPITALGKFLGGFFAIAGIALLALPAGILSSGFFEILHHDGKRETKKCPHCGEEIEYSPPSFAEASAGKADPKSTVHGPQPVPTPGESTDDSPQ